MLCSLKVPFLVNDYRCHLKVKQSKKERIKQNRYEKVNSMCMSFCGLDFSI